MFPKVKSALKGTTFETDEAEEQKATEVVNVLSENDIEHCFDQLFTYQTIGQCAHIASSGVH